MPASERKTEAPGLTGRQERFVREYLVDRNGTAAAKRAGYKGRRGVSLAVTASRLLKRPAVAQLVAAGEAKLAERTAVSAERVITELARVAFSDIGKAFGSDGLLLPLHEMPPEARAALAGVDTEELFEGKGEERTQVGLGRKVRLWDKVRALEILAKHLGMFTRPGGVHDDLSNVSDSELLERLQPALLCVPLVDLEALLAKRKAGR